MDLCVVVALRSGAKATVWHCASDAPEWARTREVALELPGQPSLGAPPGFEVYSVVVLGDRGGPGMLRVYSMTNSVSVPITELTNHAVLQVFRVIL